MVSVTVNQSYTLLCLPISFYQIQLSGISLAVKDQNALAKIKQA